MKISRRLPFAILIFVLVFDWILPAGIGLYIASTAPAVARVAPANLKDSSISPSSGTKLSYFGLEFEVPWSDLDTSQTHILTDTTDDKTAWISFRSGLKLFVATRPQGKTAFNYAFLKQTYELTPDKLHYWVPFSNQRLFRQIVQLQLKSNLLRILGAGAASSPAESGIFDVQNDSYRGFQLGDPASRPGILQLNLYSYDGTVEIKILQNAYPEPAGVTQPEINCIIQSLRRIQPGESVAQR